MNPLRQLEQTILAEGREWTRLRLEAQLQAQAHALEALCPQSGLPLHDTRWRDLQLDTAVAQGSRTGGRQRGLVQARSSLRLCRRSRTERWWRRRELNPRP